MMNQGRSKVFWLAMALIIGMLGCGGEAPQQQKQEGRLERMKPKEKDGISKLMDRNWDNLNYIMYGFINYDTEKIKTATANLAAVSKYMVKKITPQHREHKVDWNKYCNVQRELAANMRRQFEEQNFDESRGHLLKLIENCMECHKLYRKHLIRPKGDEGAIH